MMSVTDTLTALELSVTYVYNLTSTRDHPTKHLKIKIILFFSYLH